MYNLRNKGMEIEKRVILALLEDQDNYDLIRTISESYQFAQDPPTTAGGGYFDYFDWLLYNENFVLLRG